MGDQLPLVRQWVLLRTLCSCRYGKTITDMAHDLGVSEKTIRRDMKVFRKIGFPLQETMVGDGPKRWRVEPDKVSPGMHFAYDEAIALYLGWRFMEPLAGTVFWKAAQCAFQKVRATLGDGALQYLDQFGPLFHHTTVGISDYEKKADLIDELVNGIESCQVVSITYQSLQATESTEYEICPYGLVYHRGALYVVGCTPDDDYVLHWKVNRIEAVEMTEASFERPKDFTLQQHLSKSFGVFQGDGDVTIRVRFSPRVSRYVAESQWHESQKLTPQMDGSVVAEFQLSDTEEIKRWILGFGQDAVVLEPKSLRDEIVEMLGSLLTAYQAEP